MPNAHIPQEFLIVNGARHHADNIELLIQRLGKGNLIIDCTAQIQHEPTNPKDQNAVAVLVENLRVGYISAEKSPTVLKMLDGQAAILECTLFWNGDPEPDFSLYAVQLFS
jgi:hypothetical protein